MVSFINKDITTITEGIICHQVNCRGVMGAGLAKQIRNKFPKAYEEYMVQYRNNNLWLGNVIFTIITETPILFIASLCGQDKYGRQGIFTNYQAVRECLTIVAKFKESLELTSLPIHTSSPIYIPDHMGCTLGGGDWEEVLQIIHEIIPDAIITQYG